MPNRIIRDSIRTSNSLSQLTAEEERHFYRLTVYADDHGRFDARPEVILGACYSLMLNSISAADVRRWTQRLSIDNIGILTLYTVDGKEYGVFRNWEKHQRIRNSTSKWPEPPSIDSECPRDAADAPVTVTVNGNGNGNASLRDVAAPPKKKTKQVKELTSEQRTKIENDYSDVPDLTFQIDLAMAHTARQKYTDMNLYLRNWLNRAQGDRNGKPGNNPATNNHEGAIARAAREQAERSGSNRSGES